MELIDKYSKCLERLDKDEYANLQRRKRDVITIRNLIKRYDATSKQSKAYQQAIARYNVDFPNYAYELQGYVLEEQSKLKKGDD